MPLVNGARIGPYEIVSAIGAGGMGEVYRARDTRLDRDVAIKVLPELFAADPERLARFEREAKTLAALNHPHIAQIYGLEKSSGVQALVMELVEGEDLSQRIACGPIPHDEVLPIAKQIAEALETAHEQGIIHRDLKPANIKVRDDGTVKVLDFGLAKLAEGAAATTGGTAALSMSPTITSPAMLSGIGMLMGTAAYMSPEQAKGRPADKRSDIWAFGCVLYEMLTGKRAFEGDDIADTLAFVITKEPDWDSLPPSTPGAVRRLLHRSLEKDRRRRLADIADARLDIDEGLHDLAPTDATNEKTHDKPSSSHRLWVIAAVSLIASLAALPVVVIHLREQVPERPTVRVSVLPPEPTSTFVLEANFGGSAISPDGRQLAFVAEADGRRLLYVRALDSLSARALPGTEDAARPFWSPDSRNIGFVARGQLRRIGLNEGAPRVICAASLPRGATWNADGVIVFSNARPGVLNRVPAAGGMPVPVTAIDEAAKETFHYWPQFLPDGKHFLFLARRLGRDNSVYVASLDDPPGAGKRIRLVDSSYGAVFAPSRENPREGYLLFVQGVSLMAQRFDSAALKLSGEAEPIAQHVGGTETSSYVDVSASQTGVLAYGNQQQGEQRLVWFERSGKSSGPVSELATDANDSPRISPDGQTVVASSGVEIWRMDLAKATATRFTFSRSDSPVWSPDGREIAFRGDAGIFRKPVTGTLEPSLLLAATWGAGTGTLQDWSDDGKFLLYSPRPSDPTRTELWAAPINAGGVAGKPFLYLKLPGQLQTGSRFSRGTPMARWVAYDLPDGLGSRQIFVQDFPNAHGKWQISIDGGMSPRWSRDGRELFFVTINAPQRLMAVAVKSNAQAFEAGPPVPVFQSPRLSGIYDVSGNGERFLFAVRDEQQNPRLDTITLVQNWESALSK